MASEIKTNETSDLIEVLKALAPIIDQLNFSINITLEGQYKDGKIDPKVKADISLERDIEQVTELAKVRFAAAAGNFAKFVTPDVTSPKEPEQKPESTKETGAQ